jgi:predicted dehydrogenase
VTPLRAALVGLGDAGRHHARALAALAAEGRVAWTAVVGRDPERVAAAWHAAAVPAPVRSVVGLDALLDDGDCDAVVLATPDGQHADQVVRCAERGLAVLVEKPLALSAADARRAVDACRAAGVGLSVGYHLRHHAGHQLVRERLDDLVGRLRHVDVRWAWPDPATDGWRARGDGARFWSLAALGTHGIDLAMWLAGGPPAEVAAVREPPRGIDRAADVALRWDAGVLGHVAVAITHRAVPRLVIAGDAGEVECTGTLGARGDGAIAHRRPREAPTAIPFDPIDPYRAQLEAFLDGARGGGVDAAAVDNVAILEQLR